MAKKDTGPKVVCTKVNAEGKPHKDYGGARGAYVTRLREFNGKPLAELKASCEANPPSTPDKGKYEGKAEPFSGWLSFYKTEGLIKIAD